MNDAPEPDTPEPVAPEPAPWDPAGRARFIRANTMLLSPPLVPEIRLHVAEESLPIWQKTEEELGGLQLPPPFWAFAWAGGQALARYVLDHSELVAGKRILDLGAGGGIVAIAAMQAGAASAVAADVDGFAAVAARLNAEANGVTLEIATTDLLDTEPDAYDVLLVGDLFYEADLTRRVLAFMLRALASGSPVLVGDPRRSYFPKERFEKLAEYDVPTTRELEDSELKRAAVWRFLG